MRNGGTFSLGGGGVGSRRGRQDWPDEVYESCGMWGGVKMKPLNGS